MLPGSDQNYYNHNAREYARRTLPGIDQDVLQAFAARVPSGGRILDAGCGPGRDLKYFADRGYVAEGFDLAAEMVRLATECAPQARVWQADLRLLTVPKGSYDGIWAHRVLIHLDPPGCQRALGSFFAALRPGGALFVSVETTTELPAGQTFVVREDRQDDPNGPARQLFFYPREEFASLLRQSGFQVISVASPEKNPARVGFLSRRI